MKAVWGFILVIFGVLLAFGSVVITSVVERRSSQLYYEAQAVEAAVEARRGPTTAWPLTRSATRPWPIATTSPVTRG